MSWKLSSQMELVLAMKLAVFWIVAALSCCECSSVDERQVTADIKQLDSNRNIPALFKRTYVEWLGETACISQSLKSSEAEIKQKGPLRFSMKARTSARTEKPLMKVELWLEFYNLTREVNKSSRYEASIRPVDSEIPSTNQTSPEPVISEEGRLVEISFNVTEIYHTSKALGKKHVHFRIHIRGHPKRSAKELHGSSAIKAFLIIQEYEEICNDYFPLRQPGRFKRDLDAVEKKLPLNSRGVHISDENLYHQHHRKNQPTVNTMLSILQDIADIPMQSHLRKQSSRMLLKNLRSGMNTRTHKNKKIHFHHEPSPTHSKLNILHEVDTNTSNRYRFQKKMPKTLRSDSNIWRAGGAFIKDLNNNHPPPMKSEPRTFQHINTDTSNEFQKRSHSRNVLKALHPNSDANTRTSCGLTDWYVSFEHIGWDSWVIAPAGVKARTCSGVCSFPLGSNVNSTAHAHLQSFVYYFKGEKWPACCVPNDFEPLTMILYDVADSLLFMAKYPNMIATSCACL